MASPRSMARVVYFRPSSPSSSDREFWFLVQQLRRLQRTNPSAYAAIKQFTYLKSETPPRRSVFAR